MTLQVWLIVSLIVLALFSLFVLALRESRESTKMQMGVLERQIEKQAELLDKMTTLLATKEPLAFQAVQAMNLPISTPSEREPEDISEVYQDYGSEGDVSDREFNAIQRELGITGF